MRFSVVLAAHNEEENIGILVFELLNKLGKYVFEVIVVNDASTDNTAKVVELLMKKNRQVKLINRVPPCGVGRALKDGFRAVSSKAEWVLMMDSDFIYNVPEVSRLIEKAGQGFAGVIGSRYMSNGRLVNYPLLKMVSNRLYHLLLRLLLGIRQHDLTNNFKLYRTEIVKGIRWESNDFAINAETGLFPILKGYKIAEVPVSWIERSYGKSSFKVFTLAFSYLKVFWRGFLGRV